MGSSLPVIVFEMVKMQVNMVQNVSPDLKSNSSFAIIMMNEAHNINAKNGTFGGICLVLFLRLNWNDLLQSMLIAAVGAATSFTVSFLLNKVAKKWNR